MTSRNQREGVYLGFFGKHWRGKVSTLIRSPKSVYGCIRLCVKEAEKRSAEDLVPSEEQVDKLTSWAIKRMQEQHAMNTRTINAIADALGSQGTNHI